LIVGDGSGGGRAAAAAAAGTASPAAVESGNELGTPDGAESGGDDVEHLDEEEGGMVSGDDGRGLPRRGALTVYSCKARGGLTDISSTATAGLGYGLAAFNRLLVATCNSQVVLYAWSERRLTAVTAIECGIMALSVSTLGDFVLVSDLLQSMSLLIFRHVERSLELELLCKDVSCGVAQGTALFASMRSRRSLTDKLLWHRIAADFLTGDADYMVAGDNKYNLHVMRLTDTAEESHSQSEPGAVKLQIENSFYSGESILKLAYAAFWCGCCTVLLPCIDCYVLHAGV
jgi:hypothetical protein